LVFTAILGFAYQQSGFFSTMSDSALLYDTIPTTANFWLSYPSGCNAAQYFAETCFLFGMPIFAYARIFTLKNPMHHPAHDEPIMQTCIEAIDVLTGFLSADGDAFGRPVGVAMAKDPALLVVDDVGNTIWRVATTTTPPIAQ
jgi:hypothetical protein